MNIKALMQKRKELFEQKAQALNDAQQAIQAAHSAPEDQREAKKAEAQAAKEKVEAINAQIEDNEYLIDQARSQQEYERNADSAPVIEGGRDRMEDKPWDSIGQFAQVVRGVTCHQVTDPRLSPMAASGMNTAIPSEGGFAVPETLASELLRRMYDTGQILSRCDVTPMSGDGNSMSWPMIDETSRANGSRFGGIRGYWGDEGGTLTASKPKIGKLRIELEKVHALMYMTDELMMDAGAMTAEILNLVPEELVFKAEDAIINGDGAGKPKGILATGGNSCLVSVAKETGQEADTVVQKNISKMWARLWARSRMSAIWIINQDVEPQLDELAVVVGTGGAPVYMGPNGLSDLPYGRLKSRQVIPVEYCATLGDAGDIVLADFSQYKLLTKGGVKQAQSMHVKFTTDEMTFRWTWRVNGQPKWSSALTPFKGTNTQSPFVSLAAR